MGHLSVVSFLVIIIPKSKNMRLDVKLLLRIQMKVLPESENSITISLSNKIHTQFSAYLLKAQIVQSYLKQCITNRCYQKYRNPLLFNCYIILQSLLKKIILLSIRCIVVQGMEAHKNQIEIACLVTRRSQLSAKPMRGNDHEGFDGTRVAQMTWIMFWIMSDWAWFVIDIIFFFVRKFNVILNFSQKLIKTYTY